MRILSEWESVRAHKFNDKEKDLGGALLRAI